jgi:hypothetical protein
MWHQWQSVFFFFLNVVLIFWRFFQFSFSSSSQKKLFLLFLFEFLGILVFGQVVRISSKKESLESSTTDKRNFGYRSGRTVNVFIMFWQLPRTYCLNMATLQSFFLFECGNLGVSFPEKYSLYSVALEIFVGVWSNAF